MGKYFNFLLVGYSEKNSWIFGRGINYPLRYKIDFWGCFIIKRNYCQSQVINRFICRKQSIELDEHRILSNMEITLLLFVHGA